MQVQFTITGTMTLPEGTRFSDEQFGLLILPDGSSITVQPILEHNPDPDSDDHRNLTYQEGEAMDVIYEMDERTLQEIKELTDA